MLLMCQCIRYLEFAFTKTTNDKLMVLVVIVTLSLVMVTFGVVVILGLIVFYMKCRLKIDETQAVNMKRSTLPRYFLDTLSI